MFELESMEMRRKVENHSFNVTRSTFKMDGLISILLFRKNSYIIVFTSTLILTIKHFATKSNPCEEYGDDRS